MKSSKLFTLVALYVLVIVLGWASSQVGNFSVLAQVPDVRCVHVDVSNPDCGLECGGWYDEAFPYGNFGSDHFSVIVQDVNCQFGQTSCTQVNIPTKVDDSLYCSEHTPTPAPTPTPTPDCGYGYTWQDDSCVETYPEACTCSPVVVDVSGNGFDLTSSSVGVSFNLDGRPRQLAWTSPGSDDGWLALDRNGNGVIDNGSELFGNFTPQAEPPPGEEKNGFLALAVFDQPANGGDGDGRITAGDQIFSRLRLWQDVNHN